MEDVEDADAAARCNTASEFLTERKGVLLVPFVTTSSKTFYSFMGGKIVSADAEVVCCIS